MIKCFTTDSHNAIAIDLIKKDHLEDYLKQQTDFVANWLHLNAFKAKAQQTLLVPNQKGDLAKVVCGYEDANFWALAQLPKELPGGCYYFQDDFNQFSFKQLAICWGLGHYQFQQYKKKTAKTAKLVLKNEHDNPEIFATIEAIYLIRDLINIPAEDLGPEQLAEKAKSIAKENHAKFSLTQDKALQKLCPALFAIGKASHRKPCLIELNWGEQKHPKIVLIGKGVCFDTGGLNLKGGSNMSLMKKDMGGAAHVLGLAQLIMQMQLPVQLQVLIGSIDNVVASESLRPGDVINSHKGLTIEVTNTDAEGRLVICDALTIASLAKPDLIIDMTTLTGAARVALGTEIAVMFSNRDDIANELLTIATQYDDPVWRLPLFAAYHSMLHSSIADTVNDAGSGYAGAITAALFLQQFLANDVAWLHFDLMAWNVSDKPGRPQGGEALAIRALWQFLKCRYSQKNAESA